MFKNRIISSLLVAVMMLALIPMTSVFADSLPIGVTWELIANDQLLSDVRNNLNLVTRVRDDAKDSNGIYPERDVVWTSTKPHVINTDGVVTRGEKDEAVTITGVYGGRTRTYNVIVPSYTKPGSVSWTDRYLSDTLNLTVTRWAAANSMSYSSEYSPKQWTFDAGKQRFSTQTNYGTWGSNYGLTINGVEYKWAKTSAENIADIKVDERMGHTDFTFNGKNYTFYYVPGDFVDANADNQPYRFGVLVTGTYMTNWTSLYVNINEETGDVTVDTTKPIGVALEGYIRQDLKPVVLEPQTFEKGGVSYTESKFRSHLNLLSSGNRYPTSEDSAVGYERFSFRYRQLNKGTAYNAGLRSEPEFVFFCNNKSIAIHPQFGPGAVDNNNRYFGGIPGVWYKDDFSANTSMGKAGYDKVNAKVAPALSELEIKTSDEGLSKFPTLTNATYGAWLEITMETNRANKSMVMYANGQPVYWKVTVDGVTYWSPYIAASVNGYDSLRTGFSSPFVEKVFTDFEIENAELIRWKDENVAAVSVDPAVASMTGDTATINFTRTGAYTVIFADFDAETGAFVDASYVPVTVTAAGAKEVTATKTAEWDKVFLWSSKGSIIPVIDSVDIADISAAE